MMRTFKLSKAFAHGCAFGLTSVVPKTVGMPMSKTWAIATNCGPMHALLGKECSCKRDHAQCRGKDASFSENYTVPFVECVHGCFREFVRKRSSHRSNFGPGPLPCSAPALPALSLLVSMDPRGWKRGSHSGSRGGAFNPSRGPQTGR